MTLCRVVLFHFFFGLSFVVVVDYGFVVKDIYIYICVLLNI